MAAAAGRVFIKENMYEIPDSDKHTLITLCGLEPGDGVPDEVERAYWEFKRYYDRAYGGRPLQPEILTRFAMTYVKGSPRKEEYDPEPTVEKAWMDGSLKTNDLVSAKYRNKWHDAVFIHPSADGKECRVRIGDDERTIKTENVKVLQLA